MEHLLRQEVKLDGFEYTDQGFLKCRAQVTRVGIFTYTDPSGEVRKELRMPSEVFNPHSLKTLAACPITDEHPPEWITSENVHKYEKGHVSENVTHDDTYVHAELVIKHKDLIDAVMSGKVEVSCGYKVDAIKEAGRYQGENYDSKHANIVYNHLAVTRKGRAGESVRIRLDDKDQIIEPVNVHLQKEVNRMANITIGKANYEVSEAVAAALSTKFEKDAMSAEELSAELEASKAELASTIAKMGELEKALEELKGENTAQAAELDGMKEKVADMKSLEEDMDHPKLDSIIEKREALRRVAKEFNVDTTKVTKASEIKKACVAKAYPNVKLDSQDESFIEGMFTTLAKREPSKTVSANETKTDSVPTSGMSAAEKRLANMEKLQNAWRR